MRVYITKDCFDGSKSKTIETDLEGTPMSQLMFMLMHTDVASITITRKFDLQRGIAKASAKEDEE